MNADISAPRRGQGRRGLALTIMLGAQLMIILDATVVNIALPHIQNGLHFSSTNLSWVMNGYTLTFGGLLLLGGRAGDILGRRRMFIAGLTIFTLASLAGGLATTAGMLLAARAIQGVGGALASPAVLALVVSSFPEGRERVKALAIYSAVVTGGLPLRNLGPMWAMSPLMTTQTGSFVSASARRRALVIRSMSSISDGATPANVAS